MFWLVFLKKEGNSMGHACKASRSNSLQKVTFYGVAAGRIHNREEIHMNETNTLALARKEKGILIAGPGRNGLRAGVGHDAVRP